MPAGGAVAEGDGKGEGVRVGFEGAGDAVAGAGEADGLDGGGWGHGGPKFYFEVG